MAENSKIEWTNSTWSPVTGCSPISEGCDHCYAKRMATRLRGRCGYPQDDPFKVTFHEDKLDQPLRWKKPQRIFVCSMGDLFHPDVPYAIYRSLALTFYSLKRHTFLLLTKRPERMAEIVDEVFRYYYPGDWPFPNVWLGVTVELAEYLHRIPTLLQIPAAKRFVSLEPMLSPISLRWLVPSREWYRNKLNKGGVNEFDGLRELSWVIAGCESGPGRRESKTQWFRNVKNQCVEAGVPFFLKQMSVDGKIVKMPELDGRVWDEKPK